MGGFVRGHLGSLTPRRRKRGREREREERNRQQTRWLKGRSVRKDTVMRK